MILVDFFTSMQKRNCWIHRNVCFLVDVAILKKKEKDWYCTFPLRMSENASFPESWPSVATLLFKSLCPWVVSVVWWLRQPELTWLTVRFASGTPWLEKHAGYMCVFTIILKRERTGGEWTVSWPSPWKAPSPLPFLCLSWLSTCAFQQTNKKPQELYPGWWI